MAPEGKDEKCFSIDWKIENMSYCLEKVDERIVSPSFVVDEMDRIAWCITVYPRGQENCNGDYISVYLHRNRDDNPVITLKFEIAFIGKDGSVLVSKKYECDFQKGEEFGFPLFAKRDEVCHLNQSIFLPQDALTVRCRMWKNCESMSRDVRYFARTRVGVQKRSFVWNLENFDKIEEGKRRKYLIKSPMKDASLMSIDLFVASGVNSDGIICFELSLQDKTIKYSTFKLSVVDVSGNKVRCNWEEFWFDDQRECESFTFFYTEKKLLADRKVFLPNGVLSLHWECAFSKGIVLGEIEEVQDGCTSSEVKISDSHEVKNGELLPSNSPIHNIKYFYDKKFLCDVKLKTRTSTFLAHKVILSAASSVFKTMFSGNMKEKGSDCVDIEGLDDDVVRRMLHYIYTSRVEGLSNDSAVHLYYVAHEYAILSLKNVCVSYIKNNSSDPYKSLPFADKDDKMGDAILDWDLRFAFCALRWTLIIESKCEEHRLFFEDLKVNF
ncbi:hypothetical protein AVEN_231139-1 [Araneus ventricosus]|uniref:Speckle-type POZ protein n=1 Tax=Araneus ventricosus TaxID=182803 RepID=A0A4Y2KXM3_ARAVE|nr:hypothetical protein AVEN_231139-1 [Araneus ventricosus]